MANQEQSWDAKPCAPCGSTGYQEYAVFFYNLPLFVAGYFCLGRGTLILLDFVVEGRFLVGFCCVLNPDGGQKMKLEHARERVLGLWRNEKKTWRKDDYTTFFQAARAFYDKIKRNNREVLDFRNLGDKWQIINRWIHEYEGYLHF